METQLPAARETPTAAANRPVAERVLGPSPREFPTAPAAGSLQAIPSVTGLETWPPTPPAASTVKDTREIGPKADHDQAHRPISPMPLLRRDTANPQSGRSRKQAVGETGQPARQPAESGSVPTEQTAARVPITLPEPVAPGSPRDNSTGGNETASLVPSRPPDPPAQTRSSAGAVSQTGVAPPAYVPAAVPPGHAGKPNDKPSARSLLESSHISVNSASGRWAPKQTAIDPVPGAWPAAQVHHSQSGGTPQASAEPGRCLGGGQDQAPIPAAGPDRASVEQPSGSETTAAARPKVLTSEAGVQTPTASGEPNSAAAPEPRLRIPAETRSAPHAQQPARSPGMHEEPAGSSHPAVTPQPERPAQDRPQDAIAAAPPSTAPAQLPAVSPSSSEEASAAAARLAPPTDNRTVPASRAAVQTGSGNATGNEPAGAGVAEATAPEADRPAAGGIAFEALLAPDPARPQEKGERVQPDRTASPATSASAPPARGPDRTQVGTEMRDGAPSVSERYPSSPAAKPHTEARREESDARTPAPSPQKPTAAPAPAADPAPDSSNASAGRVAAVQGVVTQSTPRDDSAPPAAEPAAIPPARIPQEPHRSGVAGDLHFALGGGEQRVDVHVADRSGEVRVAVRTPDQRLAGALRDDLPSLESRLETVGLRAQAWGPAASSAERGRIETSARVLSQNSQEQPGQSGHRKNDDPPPQRPRKDVPASSTKQDRKDFQWLFNSLR